jgi:hypothetical protein
MHDIANWNKEDTCDGKCSELGAFYLQQADEWYIVDGDWLRVVPIQFCPWCGKKLWKA